MAAKLPLFRKAGDSAIFSTCGQYRYRLERRWGTGKVWVFILINPSIANATRPDPTITRLVTRAKMNGAGGIVVLNLFALVSTKPTGLKLVDDPVGPENDAHLLAVCQEASEVICGWGTNGKLFGRDQVVLKMLADHGIVTKALFINDDGTPKHPLYCGYDLQPIPYHQEAA
jgi:hypothetical protein